MKNSTIMKKLLILFILTLPNCSFSQQVADIIYNPKINNAVYESGKGSVVFIDEGHHNFHTKNGRDKAFSNLLERDGYNVKEYKGNFNEKKLSKGKILVISNALNKINVKD
ncbi:MAG: thiamine pyrophosphokinase [Flavobacteriales bacterium]|jgi:thiamine pyrophosphokinase